MRSIDILIPTYNRRDYVLKNIRIIVDFINILNAREYINVIVSDNCSNDGSAEALKKLQFEVGDILHVFTQDENIGGQNNFRFLIKHSNADFLMLLGDDDFFDVGYLEKVVEYLNAGENITTILPNCYNTKTYKYRTPIGKDDRLDYPRSLKLIFLAAQMSGIVFLREGLSQKLDDINSKNMYMQMYYVGYSASKGKTVHIKTNPIRVRIPEKAGWQYPKDMFLDETFENLVFLKVPYLRRMYLELIQISYDVNSYIRQGIRRFFEIWICTFKSKNITIFTKILFPTYCVIGILRGIIRRVAYMTCKDKNRYIHTVDA